MAEQTPPTTSTSSTSTTVPVSPTQPTVPGAGTYGTPSTTIPKATPTPGGGGSNLLPSVTNPGVLTEKAGETYQYAIGVTGRRVFDKNQKLVRYEGYKYALGPRYGTTSGAGAATRTPMVVAGPREPKYFQGDEDQVFNLSSENLASLQRAMNAVGLLGDKYSPGVADNATRNAYRNLLEQANGYGEDVDAAIVRLASTGNAGRGNLTQYRVSNEKDIKAVISRVSRETLGRNLGEGDLNRLAQLYRTLEKEAGLAAGSETQQEIVAAPSPEAFTESQLGKMFPDETNARQFGSYLEALKDRYQL